jgi:K+-transporting ATPase ATPase C chain
MHHLRANVWLLALTLILTSVIYPVLLWGFAQLGFPNQAEGSLITGADGKPIGSRLIAQPFSSPECFAPRPSAASYKADASGGSNLAGSNYQLRDRVARALGPIVRYGSRGPKPGQLVGPDIEEWFRRDRFRGQPGIVAQWAKAHPALAQAWVKAEPAATVYVREWMAQHPAEVSRQGAESTPEDMAASFFESQARSHPGKWLVIVEGQTSGGKTGKRVEPTSQGNDIQAVFFDMWRQDHPDLDLEPVPADMVMASGSGLDPHITLASAMYQLDRVAGAWATKTNRPAPEVRTEIERLLHDNSKAPLGGLAGVPLVNVLDINLAMSDRYGAPVAAR